MATINAIQEAYRTTDRGYRIRESKVGCVIALLLIPAGVTLDYFVYPNRFSDFLLLRLACNCLIGIVFALHYTEFGKRHIEALTLAWLLSIQAMISYMVFMTGGDRSSYYVGLNLATTAVGVLLPTSLLEFLLLLGTTLVFYISACFFHNMGKVEFGSLYNNIYFIILTGIIGATSVYFNTRRRFTEFRLSYELDGRNKELADLDRLKSQFFANISHELRTPLTLILAPVQDLLQHSLPNPIINSLQLVHDNGLRLLKLVNDLLDVMRLEEGKAALKRLPVELNSLLMGVTESMAHLAKTQQVNLIRQLDTTSVVALGDAHSLEKIVVNLLGNAVKFTPAGGSVTVRTWREAGEVALEVSDSGIGIADADLPFIFDRFRQADGSSTRKYRGSGLGLALVKELTETMGGRVSLNSQTGVGTVVTVFLPAGPNAVPHDVSPEHIQTKADGIESFHRAAELTAGIGPMASTLKEIPDITPPDGRPTLLVVDDEPDMRGYLVDALAGEYRVLQAADGLRGLAMAREHHPELLVLDLMLPGLDGLEGCRAIKQDERTRSIKVMLLTARVDEAAKLMALENGADDFLTKPFSSVEVKTRLRNLLQTALLERNLAERNHLLEATLAELKQAQGQLLHSEKLNAIGRLAAGLLHEVNNPLNYAMMALQFAEQSPAVTQDPLLSETVSDIGNGMRRIQGIVTDLRAFAYPSEAEKQIPFALSTAVNSALNFTAHERREVGLEVEVPEQCRVLGSQSHIVQVLVNLISNSVKALESLTGRAGRIRISGQQERDRIVIRVWDNGVGIPADVLSRIFDPFFTTRDVGQGMGMGLSICHTIIRNHGGELTANSEPDQWTEFQFDLPVG